MSKLTRATIPMCPECEAEMRHEASGPFPPTDDRCFCPRCERVTATPDWGYYAPDVEGVADHERLFDIAVEVLEEECPDRITPWREFLVEQLEVRNE